MICYPATGRTLILSTLRVIAIALYLGLTVSQGIAQGDSRSLTDGMTPTGIAPGAPAGSFPLSGFDNINPYNGGLNFSLPLLTIKGRGGAGYTMILPIEQRWRMFNSFLDGGYEFHQPDYNWWIARPGYVPGTLIGRSVGEGANPCNIGFTVNYFYTLTRLTFTAPDGTETELRDQLRSGNAVQIPACTQTPPEYAGASRGQVFVSADGSAMTFVSDDVIYDNIYFGGPDVIYPSGYLMFRDGTRYRIDGGAVTWIRDRNGNRLSFTYDGYSRVSTVTDSLNRLVTIEYDVAEGGQYGLCDRITYKGFGGTSGTQRIIRISKTNLGSALRAGYSIRTYGQLFPEAIGNGTANSPHDPQVVSAVWLPDGRRYQFYYNDYSELARVTLPTGGAFEYDWSAGLDNGPPSNSGVFGGGQSMNIYRRIVERRVYSNGGTGSAYESRMTYSRPEQFDPSGDVNLNLGYVDLKQYDANNTPLAFTRHYYTGGAGKSMLNPSPLHYPGYKEGKEYKTESFDANGTTILQRQESTWQQPAGNGDWPLITPETNDVIPPNNPMITQTLMSWVDTNQVSRQTFAYDRRLNRTDVYEYDFGAGAPGPLIRRTHTDYVIFNNGVDYAGDYNIHIRNLPLQTQVFDAGGIERAETFYEYDLYDNSPNHAPLIDRQGISGLDSGFTTGYTTRGNVTRTSRALLNNSGGVTGWVNGHAQYDIAGNVVKAIDANGKATQFDFRDNFGSPDDPTVQSSENPANQAPVELGGQMSYAFPFKITNSLQHKSYTKYDYYLSRPALIEDANGVKSNIYYNDALDRPTRGVRAIGTSVASQTVFIYNDSGSPVNGYPAHSITTISDKDVFGESNSGNGLKSVALYDGLGRMWRVAGYEGSTWAIKDTKFDGLGRVSQVSNPYRAADPGSASPPSGLWTTTEYDALGRPIKGTTPDGAHVDTAYNGNQVTVTDQARSDAAKPTPSADWSK
jgi:YD repeat-containing protein